jgi:hypothetical protein
MVVQLACSNGETQNISGVTNLIEEHRAALTLVERLGKRFMEAEETEAALLGPNLDVVMAEEAAARRQAAIAPVADLREIKIKACNSKGFRADLAIPRVESAEVEIWFPVR